MIVFPLLLFPWIALLRALADHWVRCHRLFQHCIVDSLLASIVHLLEPSTVLQWMHPAPPQCANKPDEFVHPSVCARQLQEVVPIDLHKLLRVPAMLPQGPAFDAHLCADLHCCHPDDLRCKEQQQGLQKPQSEQLEQTHYANNVCWPRIVRCVFLWLPFVVLHEVLFCSASSVVPYLLLLLVLLLLLLRFC